VTDHVVPRFDAGIQLRRGQPEDCSQNEQPDPAGIQSHLYRRYDINPQPQPRFRQESLYVLSLHSPCSPCPPAMASCLAMRCDVACFALFLELSGSRRCFASTLFQLPYRIALWFRRPFLRELGCKIRPKTCYLKQREQRRQLGI
jgi:hypothetical protein